MATAADGVLRDLIRAGCGAALFGVPLLYTMELWWTGSGSSPAFSLCVLVAVIVAATVIDRTAGFRFGQERTWPSSLADGVEVTGLIAVSLVTSHGIVFSADFGGSRYLRQPSTVDELAHTGLAYVVALVAAALMLGLYGRLDGVSGLTT